MVTSITTIKHKDETYSIEVSLAGVDSYCVVKLLPYKGLLFSASLEWLIYSGKLEDGDATHKVDPEAIKLIVGTARSKDYIPS